MILRHRVLLGVILVGNAVAFAGVDPVTVLFTAVLALLLVADMNRLPEVALPYRVAVLGVLAVGAVQLVPLPVAVRRLLQPGFAEVMPSGWAPMSLAPWATAQVLAMTLIAFAIALASARMAATRSGLPTLLWMVAATGAVLAVLGLVGEAGAPENVLLVRANTGGGSVYGPFVNSNHFAQGVELTLPAMLVLLAASLRHVGRGSPTRQATVVTGLGALVLAGLAVATLVRSGSRGGVLFLTVAVLASIPLWRGPRRLGWRTLAVVVAVLLVAAIAVIVASSEIAALGDEYGRLLMVEGLEGNTRVELWQGTVGSWLRAPVLGSGLGAYPYVIGLDKPATGGMRLSEAHNDWLEWGSTAGVVGFVLLAVGLVGLVRQLWPGTLSTMRFELRYPMAGAALAMIATALHETVGFGLQTPLNLYLAATWVGLVWGVTARSERHRQGRPKSPAGGGAPESAEEAP